MILYNEALCSECGGSGTSVGQEGYWLPELREP